MKLKSLLFWAALTSTSCANQSEGFSISKFYPLGAGCDILAGLDTAIAGNGYLDVAADAPQFFVGIRITGAENIQQNAVVVGGTVLERENRNRPLVNQQVVNYRLSKPLGGAPKPYITNINLPFSEDGQIFGAFQLISPELGLTLTDRLQASSGTAPSTTVEDFVDINVDVEFKGEFSASKTPFSTGVLTFPIRAYKSLPVTCTSGLGYVKYFTEVDMTTGTTVVDLCRYVGQSTSQLFTPPSPACCTAAGAAGGC